MMNSPWPQGCENSDGYAWALVLFGETVAKECCGAGPCTHGWKPLAAEDFSAQFLCTRKHLCLHKNWKFKHAKRILDVIMLQYLAYLACGCSLYLSHCKNHTKNAINDTSGIADIFPGLSPIGYTR